MNPLDFIHDVLQQAAEQVRDFYAQRNSLSVKTKHGPTDLVTAADLHIQQFIYDAIAKHFPGDHLVAEEQGFDTPPENPDARCWVLDPIDGTHNFATGLMPSFGVSLALVENGIPLSAGIALPMLEQNLLAAPGKGATRNGEPIHVSATNQIDHARVEVDFSRTVNRHLVLTRAHAALEQIGQIRSHGSAVVGLAAVATGEGDGYLHPSLHPWDYAAAIALITEAGGRITRFNGDSIHLFDGRREVLAANPAVHTELLSLLTLPPPPGDD